MRVANQRRPDIVNAVRPVARVSHDPKKTHWKAARQILDSLRATANLGLTYRRGGSLDVGLFVYNLGVGVYVDAYYSSRATDRCSVTGAVVKCGGAPVAWLSRTQQCVILSTTEAEYAAVGGWG